MRFIVFFFFFSSRRRHTRFSRDWSSDVCSSDLRWGYMRKALLAVVAALFCISLAHAQTDVLIEIDRGRTEGLFTKSPVFQRAILAKPAKPTDTALLYFRSYPGIAR